MPAPSRPGPWRVRWAAAAGPRAGGALNLVSSRMIFFIHLPVW
ncbi:MAG TPA: hypothetical protein VFE65_15235 [Pseudonocardia sp.]|nr:hypothetical protein [Pseudonocardia sp.]